MLSVMMGLPLVYRYAALIGVVLAAIMAVKIAMWRAEVAGKEAGKAEIYALWNKEKVQMQSAVIKAQEDARQQEQAAAASIAAAVNHYREALKREKDKTLGALLDSGVRLSVPANCPGSGGRTGETAVAAAGTTVPVRAELSREAAEFLDGEAGRADAIVRTLNLCVETLAIERKK